MGSEPHWGTMCLQARTRACDGRPSLQRATAQRARYKLAETERREIGVPLERHGSLVGTLSELLAALVERVVVLRDVESVAANGPKARCRDVGEEAIEEVNERER